MSLVLEGKRNVIFADTWRMSLFWKGSVMLYLQTHGECHCFWKDRVMLYLQTFGLVFINILTLSLGLKTQDSKL